jgi:hypothetical protein
MEGFTVGFFAIFLMVIVIFDIMGVEKPRKVRKMHVNNVSKLVFSNFFIIEEWGCFQSTYFSGIST